VGTVAAPGLMCVLHFMVGRNRFYSDYSHGMKGMTPEIVEPDILKTT